MKKNESSASCVLEIFVGALFYFLAICFFWGLISTTYDKNYNNDDDNDDDGNVSNLDNDNDDGDDYNNIVV